MRSDNLKTQDADFPWYGADPPATCSFHTFNPALLEAHHTAKAGQEGVVASKVIRKPTIDFQMLRNKSRRVLGGSSKDARQRERWKEGMRRRCKSQAPDISTHTRPFTSTTSGCTLTQSYPGDPFLKKPVNKYMPA